MKNLFTLPGHTIKALVRRDFYSITKGWGPYAAAAVSFLASSFLLKNYLGTMKMDDIMVSADPLNFPLLISLVVVSFYLAIVSTISISREKDQGTLEVLFYGPVNSSSYLVSKYLADMFVYLLLAGLLVVYFLAVSLVTNIAVSWSLVKAIIMSVFSASCIICFSLFVSSFTSKMRSSIIWLVAILLLFLAIQSSHNILLSLSEEAVSPVLVYLRNTLSLFSGILDWVSPFSLLDRGMESISIGNPKLYVMNVVFALVYSVVFLLASMLVLERKGVRG